MAHKGLEAELRDARANPTFLEEARRLAPFRTIPVLVDQGRAMGDSNAISHWLDREYPKGPRLWPDGEDAADALQIAALVDVALNHLVDVGTRYYALREHPAWDNVKKEMLGRAERALDALGERVSSLRNAPVARSGWSAADMWLYTLVAWIEGLPARARVNPTIAQVLSLGVGLPNSLSKWADAHRDRADVRGLD